MKKILFFSHYPTEYGLDGANKMLYLTTKSLSDQYEQVVIAPGGGYLTRDLAQAKIPVQVIDYDCDYYNRMIFHAKDKTDLDEICQRLESSLQQSKLYQFFQEWQPDLVYVNTIVATPAAILGQLVGAKVIWHLHDIIDNFLTEIDQQNLIQILNRYGDKLLVVSKGVQQALGELGQAEKCELIYSGLEGPDLSLEEWKALRTKIRTGRVPHPETPYIGYLGQITSMKGVHHFVRAANIVLEKIPGAKFVIIGDLRWDSEYSDQLQNLVKQLGREQQIQFWGYCPDLDQVLPGLDGLVLPAVYDDSLPTDLIQGNLYHLPVIGYNRGGISEVIAHQTNGLLVEPDQIQYLADAMLELIHHPERRWQMGELGYRRASYRFGFSRYMRNIREIVAEVDQDIYANNPVRDGKLVKGSGEEIFLLEGGARRKITNLRMYKEMGFGWQDVEQVPDELIASLPAGLPYSLPYLRHYFGFLTLEENCVMLQGKVTDPLNGLLQHWNLHCPEIDDPTSERKTYWVTTGTGEHFILRRKGQIQRPEQPGLIEQEYQLLTYLAHTDLSISLPLLATNGTFYVKQDGYYYCLYPELAGKPLSDQYSLPDLRGRIAQLGQTLAQLHQILRTYGESGEFLEMDLIADTFGKVQANLISHCCQTKQNWLIRLIYRLQAELSPIYDQLPTQLIHRNLHTGNILFEQDQVTGIMDFEMAIRGVRLYDLCYLAIAYLPDQLQGNWEEWRSMVRTLVKGYQMEEPLSPVERESFGTVLVVVFLHVLDSYVRGENPEMVQHLLQALYWVDEQVEMWW